MNFCNLIGFNSGENGEPGKAGHRENDAQKTNNKMEVHNSVGMIYPDSVPFQPLQVLYDYKETMGEDGLQNIVRGPNFKGFLRNLDEHGLIRSLYDEFSNELTNDKINYIFTNGTTSEN